MGLFGKLFGKSSQDSQPKADLVPARAAGISPSAPEQAENFKTKTVRLRLTEEMAVAPADRLPEPVPAPAKAAVNIWDMDNKAPAPIPAAAPPATVSIQELTDPAERVGGAPGRKRRAKTRLLGFDKSNGQVVDMFNNPIAVGPTRSTRFPVGWIIVVEGPGRGESFTLQAGMSPIGRGEDQVVQLDFGDSAISRTNHAAIVYDPESFQFFLGHGGKSNIVRLNNKPVISNEILANGDLIRIGETTLRFVALCNEKFNWSEDKDGELDNVEIA